MNVQNFRSEHNFVQGVRHIYNAENNVIFESFFFFSQNKTRLFKLSRVFIYSTIKQ